ncbi:MAG: thioesterase domain protein [Devosia sp.]|uniref:thioesterase domain-containing protein n=1 Tax=Devosia sp. TaxID=1871048 RepID=UPI00262D1A4A|nr:thioesterase domain-containing protein [Devosia sp.]MDB5529280.1 thioesterase domain protein [Devosia sp.]
MTPSALQSYLHDHIPLSKAMEVSVVSIADDAVVLSAPLGPNINHRETVFGGSASAVAILACWSLLHLRLTAAGLESRVVIQRNEMDYLAPISGAFTARSYFEVGANWDGFVKMLGRKGRARISIGAVLEFEGHEAGRLTGEFVALGAGL